MQKTFNRPRNLTSCITLKTVYIWSNIFIFCCLLYSKSSYSNEINEASTKAIGEGKAILKVDDQKGFILSDRAIRTLNIGFEDYFKDEISIKKDALVTSGDIKGVYRLRDHFFKLIEVIILSDKEEHYVIKLASFKNGDKYITKGVDLLRVADIYSQDKSEYKDD